MIVFKLIVIAIATALLYLVMQEIQSLEQDVTISASDPQCSFAAKARPFYGPLATNLESKETPLLGKKTVLTFSRVSNTIENRALGDKLMGVCDVEVKFAIK